MWSPPALNVERTQNPLLRRRSEVIADSPLGMFGFWAYVPCDHSDVFGNAALANLSAFRLYFRGTCSTCVLGERFNSFAVKRFQCSRSHFVRSAELTHHKLTVRSNNQTVGIVKQGHFETLL